MEDFLDNDINFNWVSEFFRQVPPPSGIPPSASVLPPLIHANARKQLTQVQIFRHYEPLRPIFDNETAQEILKKEAEQGLMGNLDRTKDFAIQCGREWVRFVLTRSLRSSLELTRAILQMSAVTFNNLEA